MHEDDMHEDVGTCQDSKDRVSISALSWGGAEMIKRRTQGTKMTKRE